MNSKPLLAKKNKVRRRDSSRSFQTRDFRMGSWRPALRRSEAARSGKTFQVLSEQVGKWQCYFYITDNRESLSKFYSRRRSDWQAKPT